ncbi:restriction endonuclease [Bacillus sp. MUM 13]|uniref:restriction endonuclease n=1 Tax=Bacillus sp. MUM 13 TaxID=1678001 RepID=UPI0008F5B1AE|nr:restriction endonuclease [Bacillus sp. MUM 13]OIK04296.1 hypothetical protein BIV59_22215 [Bacillus sp. MUM 13]
MNKKQKKALEDLIWGAIVLLSFWIFFKTSNIMLAAGTFFFLILIIIFYRGISSFLYQKHLKRSGIHQIDKMTGTQFEQYLELLFTQKGYKVSLTKSTGDFGADLILKSTGGKTIVVQAKRYSKNVGIKAVQEVVSAVPHYKGTEAWVVTNSYYTEAAKKLAVTNNVQLYNRDHLIKWILNKKIA